MSTNSPHIQNALTIAYLIIGSLSYTFVYVLGEIRLKNHGYEMLDLLAIVSAISCFVLFAVMHAVYQIGFLKWLMATLIVLMINFLLMAVWVNWFSE